MNIGFDAKRYFHNKSGLGNYSRDLVNSLILLNPNDNFFLFDKTSNSYSDKNKHIIKPLNPSFLWREFGIKNDIIAQNLDVFHGLSNELPFGKWPSSIKRIVTIHDVIFKTHPEKYSFLDRFIYDIKTKHAIESADCIIATSQETLKQMSQFYQFEKQNVHIVYQTCNDDLWIKKSDGEILNFRQKFNLNGPFILYVSSFNQRKNHIALLKAFKKLNTKEYQLVLAGQKGDSLQSVLDCIDNLQLDRNVVVLPNFDQHELPLLYQSAKAFVYPSLTEGFGIPLLEAMVSGLPILASDLPVFREIASNDVLFFNLNDEDNLLQHLNLLLEMKPVDYHQCIKKYRKESISEQMMKIYKQ